MAAARRNPLPGVTLALVFVAPLVVLGAAVAAHFGLIDRRLALETVSLLIAQRIAWGAAAGALAAVVFLAVAAKGRGVKTSGLALILAVAVVGVFTVLARGFAVAHPTDVSTAPQDPPGGAGQGVQTCGLQPISAQVTAQWAGEVLTEQGWTVDRAGLFDLRARKTGFWFGRPFEGIVRIRPGRTDVRVRAVGPGVDGGEACRLAERLLTGLAGR